MSNEQLMKEAMALPLPARVSLAQALWQSINADLPESDECADLDTVRLRDEELSSGKATGRSHEEVMQAARRAIGCD